MRRCAGVCALGAIVALAWTSGASACSCGVAIGTDGERTALAAGAKAFTGRVVSKRLVSDEKTNQVFSYVVRVGRSFNVRLGSSFKLTGRLEQRVMRVRVALGRAGGGLPGR